MTRDTHKMTSAAAGALWSLAGLLAGMSLGLAGGISFRMTVFLSALGLAVGWFGFTGTYGRLNGKTSPKLLPAPKTESAAPPIAALPVQKPFQVEEHIFSPDQARQWLDDFLVKQQRK